MRTLFFAVSYCLIFGSAGALTAQELFQVHQSFDDDPGWEGVRNRIVAKDCPTIRQDFGWADGKIGGVVWQSRTPAYYAMPLKTTLSYDEAFSFACRIAFLPVDRSLSPHCPNNAGSAYLGFFNSQRQGYRPWSSVAIRLNGSGGQQSKIGMWLAYMSAEYGAGGHDLNLDGRTWIADSTQHTLHLSYNPDATLPDVWPDQKLKSYLGTIRSSTDEVLERARRDEPQMTRDKMQQRLKAAAAQGLVLFARLGHQGRDQDTWEIERGAMRSAITISYDGQIVKTFLTEAHRRQRLALNRFGIFNHQIYHQCLNFNVSELTVNGKQIDLSQDPKWEAVGNNAEYVEQDFQRQNFGHSSETSFAGGKRGEIGGLFSRVAFDDPLDGYYADAVGTLTLENPIAFTGKMGFPAGNTDAGIFIGYFNAAEKLRKLKNADEGRSVSGSLGIFIEATSNKGYDFSALMHSIGEKQGLKYGTNFVPRAEPYTFTFEYDPTGGDDFGQIRFSLNKGEVFKQNLTRAQRESGTVFDRFGIMSRRVNGTYVVLYFDDLAYTARRASGAKPIRHEQQITVVPFPRGGRDK